MDFTYGEEVPLDSVAPLFAASRAPKSASSVACASKAPASLQHSPVTVNSNSTLTEQSASIHEDDDEMEEGELPEDGEISEDSSSEAELIAASLIASKRRGTEESQSLPQYWIQPLQPLPTATTTVAPLSSGSTTTARHQPIAGASTTIQPPLPSATMTHSVPSNPPLTPTLAEFEALIDELYTYGVTCDYLINKGITKDRVISTFAERGFKLPQHHLESHLEKQRQWGEHQDSLSSQQPVASTSELGPSQRQSHPNVTTEKGLPVGKRAVSPVVTDLARLAPTQSTNQLHRATPSLTDSSSLLRLGPLLPTPPTSAPPTSTKRRRDIQDVTLSSPPDSLLPSTSSTPTTIVMSTELKALKEELPRKEAAAKQALKARKAALAKENARRAENFIEGLLSESKVVTGANTSGDPASTSVLPPQAAEVSIPSASTILPATSSGITELEDYEDVEASLSAIPEISASSTSALSAPIPPRPDPSRRTSSTTFATRPNKLHRPVAADFESDPSHKLSNVPRWTEQLLESSRRGAENRQMLIDLSDSEDSPDDDDDEKMDGKQEKGHDNYDDTELRLAIKNSRLQDSINHSGHYQISSFSSTSGTQYPSYSLNNLTRSSESARSSPVPPSATTSALLLTHSNAKKKSPPTSRSMHSRSSTPSITYKSAPPPTASKPASRSIGGHNPELEAKQAEIRKMLEMIKKLEGKKKKKGSHREPTERNALLLASNSREPSSVPGISKSGTQATSVGVPSISIANTERQETIQAAKETVGRLLDEQERLAGSTGRHASSKGLGSDEQVGESAVMGNLLSVDSASTPRLERRHSSSDEAMCISSGDE